MSKSRLLILLLLLICAVIWVEIWQKPCMRVIFFDVGQGDAILVLFPQGGNMLIDGGEPIQGKKVILPYLRKRGIGRIDTVVLTHAHSDHVGGLVEILKVLPVGLVVESGFPHTTDLYMEFLEIVHEKNIPYVKVSRGQELTGFSGVKVKFLNPPGTFLEGRGAVINNNSVVLKLCYGETKFLLCADIEREAEKELLRCDLAAAVIKVPHHGSRTSSTLEFIEKVNPEVAIISVGRRNRFGHPYSTTIEKYGAVGSKVYRTDVDGAIIVSADGRSCKIRTLLKRKGVVKKVERD